MTAADGSGRIAFLTMSDTAGWSIDAHLAIPPLRALGWSVDTIPFEPSLYLRMDEAAPERFARALVEFAASHRTGS
ncbi:MAG: hypothetical protein U5K76_11960 [Woeseiaceae bacterium]|nr:hypothetical protein [Woeseiaceae bacterium]